MYITPYQDLIQQIPYLSISDDSSFHFLVWDWDQLIFDISNLEIAKSGHPRCYYVTGTCAKSQSLPSSYHSLLVIQSNQPPHKAWRYNSLKSTSNHLFPIQINCKSLIHLMLKKPRLPIFNSHLHSTLNFHCSSNQSHCECLLALPVFRRWFQTYPQLRCHANLF